MITQFPQNICCSQSHHCCLITVTMQTMSYARKLLLIGGMRLKEFKLFWGRRLTRLSTRKNGISTTCQVWRMRLFLTRWQKCPLNLLPCSKSIRHQIDICLRVYQQHNWGCCRGPYKTRAFAWAGDILHNPLYYTYSYIKKNPITFNE